MTIGAAETWLTKQLEPLYESGEAATIADMVLEHLIRKNRATRRLHRDEPLEAHQFQHLKEIDERLQKSEPVQYVLGEAWFYDFKLYVDPAVLIPRPETAELVEWIIKDVRASGKAVFHKGRTDADKTTELKILDVGTGSGCIALALKKHLPLAEVWGCDASDAALNVARRNASELNIRVDFVGLDFLDNAQTRQLPTVDIIVSNPPYIPQQEEKYMHPNVVQHEPHQALFVPDEDPLLFYRAVTIFSKERLYENGTLYFEIHENNGAAVVHLLQQEGFRTQVRRDLQGKERMIKANR